MFKIHFFTLIVLMCEQTSIEGESSWSYKNNRTLYLAEAWRSTLNHQSHTFAIGDRNNIHFHISRFSDTWITSYALFCVNFANTLHLFGLFLCSFFIWRMKLSFFFSNKFDFIFASSLPHSSTSSNKYTLCKVQTSTLQKCFHYNGIYIYIKQR